MLTNNDLHYLRSILSHLREVRTLLNNFDPPQPSIGGEILADNVDWLDCFIDKWEKRQAKQKENFDAAMKLRRKANQERI